MYIHLITYKCSIYYLGLFLMMSILDKAF